MVATPISLPAADQIPVKLRKIFLNIQVFEEFHRLIALLSQRGKEFTPETLANDLIINAVNFGQGLPPQTLQFVWMNIDAVIDALVEDPDARSETKVFVATKLAGK